VSPELLAPAVSLRPAQWDRGGRAFVNPHYLNRVDADRSTVVADAQLNSVAAPITRPAVTRILWIAPGADIPQRHPEFLDLPSAVVRVAFPVAKDCAPLCTVCQGTLAAHTWQVGDVSTRSVVDCSEALS
jgi:hypothetical protein